MFFLLVFAGVIACLATTPLVVDMALGGLLFGGLLALLHGQFGAALFAFAILAFFAWHSMRVER